MALFSISTRCLYQSLSQRFRGCYLSTNTQEDASRLMTSEILQQLNVTANETILDMTFGDGLHSEAILKSNESVKIIALDRDPCAFQKATELALKYPGRVNPLLGRISDLPSLLGPLGIKRKSLDAIIFEPGCSSMQLHDANRGFTCEVDGPLDMRMDGPQATDFITAADVVMRADERDLSRVLRVYGDEERNKKIAKAIVACRYNFQPLDSTGKLTELVHVACAEKSSKAVRNVFYALRTFVNNEFNELNYAMLLAQEYLKIGGRVLALTFNQMEDTIIKRHITGNVMENSPNPVPLKYYSAAFNMKPEEINAMRSSPWKPIQKHVATLGAADKMKSHHFAVAKLRGAQKV
ncbi:hypothetical protein ONE63_001247 [Megalurothrips usitatus]|uniref:Methyltransferase-like protein 15 homolog n=1 Tax=Megalurothrips usitatus TaxID=439358 RepID=A0AAV7XBH8_9NEOP|nr:hypothetical protein ONE63_001247 [Megalurothrips usitatus]